MVRTRDMILAAGAGALLGMLVVGCASQQDPYPVEPDVLPPSPTVAEQTATAQPAAAAKVETAAEVQPAVPNLGIGIQPTTEQTSPPVGTTARPTTSPVVTNTVPPPQPPSTGTKMARPVGVAECDQYIDLIRRCFSGQSADSKQAMEQALSKTTEGWAQTARDPKARAGLADTCRLASDALLKTVCQDKAP